MKKKPKKVKTYIWSLARADKEFSRFIRERDRQCMFPECKESDLSKLQCSHYITRAHKLTRFDPENCIALCVRHHFMDRVVGFEFQKARLEEHGFDGQYTLFMKKWLGEEKFNELLARGRKTHPQSSAIIACMEFLQRLSTPIS